MFWKKQEKNIGKLGEKKAAKYLKKNGFKIIEFNYQNKKGKRLGEIDIIAEKDKQIIFIEVKSRIVAEKEVVLPEENITQDKLLKLHKISQIYIEENNLWDRAYRFDAVSILFDSKNNVKDIRHLESIFL